MSETPTTTRQPTDFTLTFDTSIQFVKDNFDKDPHGTIEKLMVLYPENQFGSMTRRHTMTVVAVLMCGLLNTRLREVEDEIAKLKVVSYAPTEAGGLDLVAAVEKLEEEFQTLKNQAKGKSKFIRKESKKKVTKRKPSKK